MKWVIVIVAIIVALGLIVYLIGYMMPVKHQATVKTTLLSASAGDLWKVITTPKDFPSWRKELKNIEVKDSLNWTETSGYGDKVGYQAEVVERERQFVTRITNKDLPYGGSWTFTLEPASKGITLTITENGEVYNPLFRFMSKFIFGHDATLKSYVKNIEAHLNKK